MKLSFGKIVEIAGFLAVILSVLFLAYEQRQSNLIARTNARIAILDNYSQINELLWTDSSVAALIVKSREPNFIPSTEERVRLGGQARRFVNVWLQIEAAYQNGYYSEPEYQSALDDVRTVIRGNPGTAPMWREYILTHPTNASEIGLLRTVKETLDTDN